MKQKLNCILLIDDSDATNFMNKRIVEKSNCAERCVAVTSGAEALTFLQSKEKGKYPQPDLILLDINMPSMNGWEFLEAYKNLDKETQGKIIIIMLTTSINPDDREKAISHAEVADYKSKPLSLQMLDEIVKEHFPERL